jgi:inosine-uridine nucleoside N-ribohydrolase
MTKVILDTDIGDDVDDALALALICALPEVELLGVTTVFGNTALRARQAQTLLKTVGGDFVKVPVAAGCAGTMASRKVSNPVADPDHIPGQHATTLPEDQLPQLETRHGVEFLIDTIMAEDGDVVPITIGAMTNLAVALVKQPKIAEKIPRIMAMAGEFTKPHFEWNILCDPEAAHVCFSSGIAIDVIPFEIGMIATLKLQEFEQMAASSRPIAKYLTATIGAWRTAWKRADAMPHLFDPMAVAAIVKPELFEWKTGTVSVELAGVNTYGVTTFKAGEGPHRVAWKTDRAEAVGWYMGKILG